MSLLTTLILAESVEKGGPGSGPHASSASVSAHQASHRADQSGLKRDHVRAQNAHSKAGSTHLFAAQRAGFSTVTGQQHLELADQHYKIMVSHSQKAK